jgi:hypothetical protein
VGQRRSRQRSIADAGLDRRHEILDEGIVTCYRPRHQEHGLPEAADETVARFHPDV